MSDNPKRTEMFFYFDDVMLEQHQNSLGKLHQEFTAPGGLMFTQGKVVACITSWELEYSNPNTDLSFSKGVMKLDNVKVDNSDRTKLTFDIYYGVRDWGGTYDHAFQGRCGYSIIAEVNKPA